jgi:hypothetical protein
MLDSLPRENIAYGVVAPCSQSCEVCRGVVERKGSVHERNIVAVEELVGYVRGQVRDSRKFDIGGAVYAVLCNHQHQYMRQRRIAEAGPHKNDLTILRVAEGPSVDTQPDGGHD